MRTFLRHAVSVEAPRRRLFGLASLILWLCAITLGTGAVLNTGSAISYLTLAVLVALFSVTHLRMGALKRAHEQGLRSAINFLYSTRYMSEIRGLADRATFLESLKISRTRAEPGGTPSVVITMQLENIEGVRDRFGDLVGSKAVKEFARTLQRITKGDDLVAYVGFGRFAILLVDCSFDQSTQFACRIPATVVALTDREPVTLRVETRRFELDELNAAVDGAFGPPELLHAVQQRPGPLIEAEGTA